MDKGVYHTVYAILSSLKGQCHEIFDFSFFSGISFPQAPEYTIRAIFFLQIFLKICRDIRSSRCTYKYIFAFKLTVRLQQPDIVPVICHWCH
jgi:hypothetical protein